MEATASEEGMIFESSLNEDIKDGWTAGWTYKIQLRFKVPNDAEDYSEWSSVCYTKKLYM